ncbi:transposase domain-containing protein [Dactylosporangium sp. NPDC051484]|uniref:transposase domain-containing protein n=1 Tax=Dactylosporangium sp. NPDC051484 TaxID=3154942 RepID=UPI003450A07F
MLNRGGRRAKRVLRLLAHVMIRYMIAMGLLSAESYDEVMRRLMGILRRPGSWDRMRIRGRSRTSIVRAGAQRITNIRVPQS